MPRSRRIFTALVLLLALGSLFAVPALHAQQTATVLTRDKAGPLIPPSVFYRGQTAPIQARNSAGLRLASGRLVLAALVDTSGYASSVQQTYQGYLLTEVPLLIGDQRLAPGAYGFGFIAGDQAVVMDIGGNRLLSAPTTPDPALPRPTPLQIVPQGNVFRLYLGRAWVTLAPAER